MEPSSGPKVIRGGLALTYVAYGLMRMLLKGGAGVSFEILELLFLLDSCLQGDLAHKKTPPP